MIDLRLSSFLRAKTLGYIIGKDFDFFSCLITVCTYQDFDKMVKFFFNYSDHHACIYPSRAFATLFFLL